ncbi:MAG: histidine phosphatase family protein [Alphaproteobacteria bacterium]
MADNKTHVDWAGLRGYPASRRLAKRLIVIRHGESNWNVAGQFQGQSGSGLSQRGHQQAAVIAAALAPVYPDAVLVSSDLLRARETVEPLESALGRVATLDPRLRERSLGRWEGMRKDEVVADNEQRWRRLIGGEDVVEEVGGESEIAFADRSSAVLRDLLEKTRSGGVTIAISHGGVIWQGFHTVAGLKPGTLGAVDNASCHHLVSYEGDGSTIAIARWNEVPGPSVVRPFKMA